MNYSDWEIFREAEEIARQDGDVGFGDALQAARKAWFRYGNYCGPGPKLLRPPCDKLADETPMPNPKNTVDAQCKQHDIDYCRCGVGWDAGLPGRGNSCSKQADKELVHKLLALKGKLPPDQQRAASIIRQYFGMWKNALGSFFPSLRRTDYV